MLRICQGLLVCGLFVMPALVSAQGPAKPKAVPAKSAPRTVIPTPQVKPVVPAPRPIAKAPAAPQVKATSLPKTPAAAPRPIAKAPAAPKRTAATLPKPAATGRAAVTPAKTPAASVKNTPSKSINLGGTQARAAKPVPTPTRITMPVKPWVDIAPIASSPRPSASTLKSANNTPRVTFDDNAKKGAKSTGFGYDQNAIKSLASAPSSVRAQPARPKSDAISGYNVPRNYADNGASVPSWTFAGIDVGMQARLQLNNRFPNVWRLHDYLYSDAGIKAYPNLTRANVDFIMMNQLLQEGSGREVAFLVHEAVQRKGQSHTQRR